VSASLFLKQFVDNLQYTFLDTTLSKSFKFYNVSACVVLVLSVLILPPLLLVCATSSVLNVKLKFSDFIARREGCAMVIVSDLASHI
jgi:hypothetical protein